MITRIVCAVDGCELHTSLPPCLDTMGRPICRCCAAAAAGGRCSYCRAWFRPVLYGYDVYALDMWDDDHQSMMRKRYTGKAVCLECWANLFRNVDGWNDVSDAARGYREGEPPPG